MNKAVLPRDLAAPTYALDYDRPPRHWLWVILLVSAFLGAALLWASTAEIDELSRAEGRVIPSSKTQVIQSAEAGVVADILVRRGEQVKKGQQLVRLDDTTTTSSAGEVEAKVRALQAQVARLQIEYEGRAGEGYTCPPDVLAEVPAVCENEAKLLQARLDTLDQGKDVLAQRVEQRNRELSEALANKARLEDAFSLAEQKLDLIKPMAEKQLVSQTEFLAAQRDVSDTRGQRDAVIESIARLEAAVSEAELQVQQAELQFRQDALSELTTRLAELSSAEQALRGASDRVSRTDIRSPVDGIVNEIAINTVGGFVQPGERLLDIVPMEDTLLVEARLKPSDVAFVLPNQPAQIKFTAYDFIDLRRPSGRSTERRRGLDHRSEHARNLLRRAHQDAGIRTELQRQKPSHPAGHGDDGRHPDRQEDRAAIPAQAYQQGTRRGHA